jgi:hypothetical protein
VFGYLNAAHHWIGLNSGQAPAVPVVIVAPKMPVWIVPRSSVVNRPVVPAAEECPWVAPVPGDVPAALPADLWDRKAPVLEGEALRPLPERCEGPASVAALKLAVKAVLVPEGVVPTWVGDLAWAGDPAWVAPVMPGPISRGQKIGVPKAEVRGVRDVDQREGAQEARVVKPAEPPMVAVPNGPV